MFTHIWCLCDELTSWLTNHREWKKVFFSVFSEIINWKVREFASRIFFSLHVDHLVCLQVLTFCCCCSSSLVCALRYFYWKKLKRNRSAFAVCLYFVWGRGDFCFWRCCLDFLCILFVCLCFLGLVGGR